MQGYLKSYLKFKSKYINARNVDVWLPGSYDSKSTTGYSVLYMHDGQMLFDPTITWNGQEWGMDMTMSRLIEQRKIKKTIIIAIWKTAERSYEYMPQEPVESFDKDLLKDYLGKKIRPFLADDYLRFIVEELKPFVDRNFNTLEGQENTYIMGSSMGGLISGYAMIKYPEIFGGAACLSTHWPINPQEENTLGNAIVDYFKKNLPKPGKHKIYFDHGTETLDKYYEPFQKRMDIAMEKIGYVRGEDWISRIFEGADHSENAWKARVHIPLAFLLKIA